MGSRRIAAAAFAAAALLALALVPAAQASFHLIQIREVYPGSLANPEAKYVELQMFSGGENEVAGHSLRLYDASGAVVGTSTFATPVANGANQSTILLATPQAEAQFGVGADLALSSPAQFVPSGGAVCWDTLDCVSWGNFSGSLPSPAGSPAAPAGIPDGMALRRTIAPNCPTALNGGDDSNDSAADFSATAPLPRPNSVPPSEKPCSASGGGGDSGTGSPTGSGGAPQTVLRRKPPKRTADRTPTFRFASDEAGARFECKLDGKPYRRCRSPFTAARLSLGAHRFRVRARDREGAVDPTPASYRFRIVARR
jgi:hypothetical protein